MAGVICLTCAAVLTLFAAGCPLLPDDEGSADVMEAVNEDGGGSVDAGQPVGLNAITLKTGYFGTDDHFAEAGSTLYTCEGGEGVGSQFALQVSASVAGPRPFVPELVQVHFTSDLSEWVSSGDGLVGVWGSETECGTAGMQCDEVVVGEGVAGFFETDDGFLAIQNIWCRHWSDEPYSYSVSALAMDINPLPHEPLTHTGTIEIHCVPLPCCPDVDYLAEHGNHTVEPWSCP